MRSGWNRVRGTRGVERMEYRGTRRGVDLWRVEE